MKTFRVAFRLAAIAFWVVAVPSVADELAPSISPAELHAQERAGTAPQVIDVRTRGEFEAGHLPGALNIPHTELASRLGEVDSQRGVALYCLMGPRARLGEKTLQQAGISKVFHLEGGLSAWREAGLPVEAGSSP